MSFVKNHWFGLFVSIIVFLFLCVFTLVLIAPHQDEQKRGFVPCTQKMAENLYMCNDQKICILKEVINNTFCNIKVIGEGIQLWITGEQSRPWSNYFFEPKLKSITTDGIEPENSLEEYYQNTPDISAEMNELYKLNQQLENSENE